MTIRTQNLISLCFVSYWCSYTLQRDSWESYILKVHRLYNLHNMLWFVFNFPVLYCISLVFRFIKLFKVYEKCIVISHWNFSFQMKLLLLVLISSAMAAKGNYYMYKNVWVNIARNIWFNSCWIHVYYSSGYEMYRDLRFKVCVIV